MYIPGQRVYGTEVQCQWITNLWHQQGGSFPAEALTGLTKMKTCQVTNIELTFQGLKKFLKEIRLRLHHLHLKSDHWLPLWEIKALPYQVLVLPLLICLVVMDNNALGTSTGTGPPAVLFQHLVLCLRHLRRLHSCRVSITRDVVLSSFHVAKCFIRANAVTIRRNALIMIRRHVMRRMSSAEIVNAKKRLVSFAFLESCRNEVA